jgi:hypothetical protein
MIARLEKSFYGMEAMLQLVSDTEPFSDSSGSASSRDPCPSGRALALHDPSHTPTQATDPPLPTNTDSKSTRQQGTVTKKRRRDSFDSNSDSAKNPLITSSKWRKKASDTYQQSTETNRESADERKAARERKAQEDLWNYRQPIEIDRESTDERKAVNRKWKKKQKTGIKSPGRSLE